MLVALGNTARHPRALWLRWALFTVWMAVTPATKHVIEDVVQLLHGGAAAARDCADCDGDATDSGFAPLSCQHCSHCTPSSILPPPSASVVSATCTAELEPVALIANAPSGYRSELFRPPAA